MTTHQFRPGGRLSVVETEVRHRRTEARVVPVEPLGWKYAQVLAELALIRRSVRAYPGAPEELIRLLYPSQEEICGLIESRIAGRG